MAPLNSPKVVDPTHYSMLLTTSPAKLKLAHRGRVLSWGEQNAKRSKVVPCPSGALRLRVQARLPAHMPWVGVFHYAPSAGNSACSFFEKDLVQEEEIERLHRIKVHPLTGCFHSRPGHYSKLHGLQNYQPSCEESMMLSRADSRLDMLARIKASLTEPSAVPAAARLAAHRKSSSSMSLDDGDVDQLHGLNPNLNINRLVRDTQNERLRWGVEQRRRSTSVLSNGGAGVGAARGAPHPPAPRYRFQGALDVHRGRFGERSVDDAATSERAPRTSVEATHWGGGAALPLSSALSVSPSGRPPAPSLRVLNSSSHSSHGGASASPRARARHRSETIAGPQQPTTILRHLFWQPGGGGSMVAAVAGNSGGAAARGSLEHEFKRQRQRSGSTVLGWESHTAAAHEKTEQYLGKLGALAPNMNPSDLLLAEITSAYDVDPEAGGGVQLGEGASATVRSGVHRETGRPVAIKTIHKRYLFTQAEQASVDREMANQRRLCHRNVVRLYETYETDQELFLVLERATCGSLEELLFVRRRLSELEAKLVLKQVLDAVLYCHAQGIVHCDLKPANIVLSDYADPTEGAGGGGAGGKPSSPPRLQSSALSISGMAVKLCDFGHSRKVPDVKYFKYTGDIHKIPHHLFQHTGTDGYIAPEVLQQEAYGKQADMWSVGVLMHKLLSGSVPWNPSRGCLTAPLALKARIWSDISDEAKDLLRGLLEVDQELRLSAAQALNHAWFEGIEHCACMPTYAPCGPPMFTPALNRTGTLGRTFGNA